MSVTAFSLNNFMGFSENKTWIELRPITLLFGLNSSGKSAIIRALRLLKQSAKYGTPEDPLVFISANGLNQNNYKTTVHRQEVSRSMTFSFRLNNTDSLDAILAYINLQRGLDDLPSIKQESVSGTDVTIAYAWEFEENEKPAHVLVESLRLSCPWIPTEKDQKIFEFAKKRVQDPYDENKWSYGAPWEFSGSIIPEISEIGPNQQLPARVQHLQGCIPNISVPSNTFKLAEEELEYLLEFNPRHERLLKYQFTLLANLLDNVIAGVNAFLDGIKYLSPLRPYPERAYAFTKQQIDAWRATGLDGFADYLSGKYPNLDRELSDWLGIAYLNLADAIKSEPHALADEMGFISQVFFTKSSSTHKDNIADMGFGLSQVLPILVETLTAPPGSLIIIEQPELHLHPGAQARLADIFINRINKNESVRFLLETHSEHLFLRFRRRIAETTSSPEKNIRLTIISFLALFVEKNKTQEESCTSVLDINKYGDMNPNSLPASFNEFFDDDLYEASSIKIAEISARKKGL